MARTVSAGSTINLRIQFKDDLGKPSEAQNTKLYIFEPGADTSDNANAVEPLAEMSFVASLLVESIQNNLDEQTKDIVSKIKGA